MMLYFMMGYVGLGFLLIAYALNLFGKINQDCVLFNLLNLFGAILLVVYTSMLDGTLFPVLLGVWGLVALYGLIKAIVGKTKIDRKLEKKGKR